MAFLDVDNVSKRFPEPQGKGTWTVFEDVRLRVEKGEFVTLVGHSGCGKSTLLFMIAGLEEASSGSIVVDGREIDGPGLDRMVVFQSFALMPWMTVWDNVRLAVKASKRGAPKEEIDAQVRRTLEMVGLADAARKKPVHLSGGMRQRVGLARAFSTQPKMLLLDEPFAQIDALTRGVIQDELVRMWERTRNTVFMVTHDVDEAILLSDKILLMTNSPKARIAEIVQVEIPRPRTRATIIDDPAYSKIRRHVLHFLTERCRSGAEAPLAAAALPPVVRFA
ncbi:MAG TPA: ABC transporter ATP-binding protein [Planctomycetota bacterium]